MNTDWTYVIVLAGIIGAAFYVMRRFSHAPAQGNQAMEQLEEKLERISMGQVKLKNVNQCTREITHQCQGADVLDVPKKVDFFETHGGHACR